MGNLYVAHGKITCPVCGKDHDEIVIWQNIAGVPFAACRRCIDEIEDPRTAKETLVKLLLRMGFGTGFEKAKQDISSFIANGMEDKP